MISALDEAVFLQRRQEIWRKLYPETKAGGARKQMDKFVHLIDSFADATADKLGVSPRTIRRRIARADELGRSGVIERVRGTWLATRGTYLDQIIKLESAEQSATIDLLLEAGEGEDAITVAEAVRQVRQVPEAAEDIPERDYQKLVRLWNRADVTAKKRFKVFLSGEAGAGRRS